MLGLKIHKAGKGRSKGVEAKFSHADSADKFKPIASKGTGARGAGRKNYGAAIAKSGQMAMMGKSRFSSMKTHTAKQPSTSAAQHGANGGGAGYNHGSMPSGGRAGSAGIGVNAAKGYAGGMPSVGRGSSKLVAHASGASGYANG